MEPIKSSELITNDDGSVFHLHLHPEDLAEQVILVGDPSRVEMIASYFEKIEIRQKVTGNFVPLPDITRDTACRLSLRESGRITSTS